MSDDEWVAAARRLKGLGLSDQQIALRLRVTPMRVHHAVAVDDAVCENCGEMFDRRRDRPGQRFCSRQCSGAAQRGHAKHSDDGKAAMSAGRQGQANPNFKHGARVGKRNRAGERRFRDEDASACRAPGCSGRVVHQHHVVYRQHVRRARGDLWAPENALGLCGSCHASHHQRGRVLPISALRIENVKFAAETLGEAAEGYLRRYYRDDVDERWWLAYAAGIWWLDGEAVRGVR